MAPASRLLRGFVTTRPRHLMEVSLSFLFGLLHFRLLSRLGDGNLIATYAQMPSDSFDYAVEAIALATWLEGGNLTSLPVLRHPGLVVILLFDLVLASGTGYFWFFVSALATSALAYGFMLAARSVCLPVFFPLTGLAIVFLSPTAHFRLFLLADHLGTSLTALSSISFALLFAKTSASTRINRTVLFNAGSFFGVAGGMFQTYSLLPILVASCILAANKSRLVFHSGGWLFGYLIVQISWRSLIPHDEAPANFSLLEPILAMWPFYAVLWSYLLPAIIVFWLGALRAQQSWTQIVYSVATVGGFAILLFFYQWADMRLSMVLVAAASAVGLVLMGAVYHESPATAWVSAGGSMLLAVAIGGLIRPSSYWVPESFTFDPRAFWDLFSLSTQPLDRWGIVNTCGPLKPWCPSMEAPDGLTPYDAEIISYLAALVS